MAMLYHRCPLFLYVRRIFSVVSCCCWSQDKKILPGTGMTNHSLPSQASQVPESAGQ